LILVVAGVIPWGICSDARESPWLSSGRAAAGGAPPRQNGENHPGAANAPIPAPVRAVGGFLRAFMAPGFWS